MKTIFFSIKYEIPNANTSLAVCGSAPFLGSWNPQAAPKMKYYDWCQTNTLQLALTPQEIRQYCPFEFKFVEVDSGSGSARWESCPNRRFPPNEFAQQQQQQQKFKTAHGYYAWDAEEPQRIVVDHVDDYYFDTEWIREGHKFEAEGDYKSAVERFARTLSCRYHIYSEHDIPAFYDEQIFIKAMRDGTLASHQDRQWDKLIEAVTSIIDDPDFDEDNESASQMDYLLLRGQMRQHLGDWEAAHADIDRLCALTDHQLLVHIEPAAKFFVKYIARLEEEGEEEQQQVSQQEHNKERLNSAYERIIQLSDQLSVFYSIQKNGYRASSFDHWLGAKLRALFKLGRYHGCLETASNFGESIRALLTYNSEALFIIQSMMSMFLEDWTLVENVIPPISEEDMKELLMSRVKLGEGGSASVFHAKFLGESVAIKKIPYTYEPYRLNSVDRIKRELLFYGTNVTFGTDPYARMVKLIGWYHSPTDKDTVCIILERATSDVKTYLLKNKSTITMVEKVRIAYQVASTLTKLHELNIAYRDLKPENVLYYEDKRILYGFFQTPIVSLTDFSISRVLPNTKHGNKALRKELAKENQQIGGADNQDTTTMLFGTIQYASPELLREQMTLQVGETSSVKPAPICFNLIKTDVWSFGMFLWAIYTAKDPSILTRGIQDLGSINSMLSSGTDTEFHKELEDSLGPDCPSWYADIMMSCLDPDPARRPDIASVKNAIEQAMIMERLDDVGQMMMEREDREKERNRAEEEEE